MNINNFSEQQVQEMIGGEEMKVVLNPNISASAREYIIGNVSPTLVSTSENYNDYQYEPSNILDVIETEKNTAGVVSERDLAVIEMIGKKYAYIEFFQEQPNQEETTVGAVVAQDKKTEGDSKYLMPATLRGEVFYDIKQHEKKSFLSNALTDGKSSPIYHVQTLLTALEVEAMILGVDFDTKKLIALRTHDNQSFIVYNKTDKITTIKYGNLTGAELDDETLGYLLTSNAFRALAKSKSENHVKCVDMFTEKYKALREVYVGALSSIISGDEYEVSNTERKELHQMEVLVNLYAPLRS